MTSLPWKGIALVLTGVDLGCGAGAAGRAVAQPLPPPPVAGVQHFQYVCQAGRNPRVWEPDSQAYLNTMGAQGWHLIPPRFAGGGDVYCFERTLP